MPTRLPLSAWSVLGSISTSSNRGAFQDNTTDEVTTHNDEYAEYRAQYDVEDVEFFTEDHTQDIALETVNEKENTAHWG